MYKYRIVLLKTANGWEVELTLPGREATKWSFERKETLLPFLMSNLLNIETLTNDILNKFSKD
jgi:hypothetical protein